MGVFIVYLVKSSICMFFFVLINKVLLERETFHLFNRVAWLSILVISLLLPFFEWGSFDHVEVVHSFEQAISVGDIQILDVVEETSYFDLIVSCIVVSYLLFTLFFGLKLMIAYCKLFIVLRSSKVDPTEFCSLLEQCKSVSGYHKEVQLIVREEEIAPFSWMNYIVISRSDLENSGREILIHELSHIKSKHSLDLIFVDLISIFQWFNPALWLAKRAIMQVHEYSADTSVIESGVDAKQYQLLLIKKAVGQRFYSMANSFNHSKLKKRITMMLQKKSSKWAVAKCLYALPLALCAVAAFAKPEVSNRLDEISSVEVTQNFEMSEFFSEKKTLVSNDEVKGVDGDTTPKKVIAVVQKDDDIFAIVETPPVFPEGKVIEWVAKRIKYPAEDRKNKLERRVYLKFVIEKDGSVSNVKITRGGVNANLDAELVRVVKTMPKWTPGKQRGKAVRCSFQMPLNVKVSDDYVFPTVESAPIFPEGNVSAWIAKRIKYPAAAQKNKIEGRVFIRFVIEKDGSVSTVEILRGVDVSLDKEAIRVVKTMPKWIPGKEKGQSVRCSYQMPINFRLSKPTASKVKELVDDDEIFAVVEVAPVFPAGNVSAWVAKNIKYPVVAQKAGIEGRVYVKFVVEKDGSVSNIKIMRGVDPSLDREAVRVVKSMPKWTPGKQRGKAVRVSFDMPINFRLQKSEKPLGPVYK